MKRDWNKVRHLLLAIEAGNTHAPQTMICSTFQNYPEADEYLRLVSEAGFVMPLIALPSHRTDVPGCLTNGLTSQGHDFLDVIRHEHAWAVISERVFQFNGLPTQIVEELGRKWLRERVQP